MQLIDLRAQKREWQVWGNISIYLLCTDYIAVAIYTDVKVFYIHVAAAEAAAFIEHLYE